MVRTREYHCPHCDKQYMLKQDMKPPVHCKNCGEVMRLEERILEWLNIDPTVLRDEVKPDEWPR